MNLPTPASGLHMHKTVYVGPLGFLCSGFALYYALGRKSLLAGRNVAGHSHRVFFYGCRRGTVVLVCRFDGQQLRGMYI